MYKALWIAVGLFLLSVNAEVSISYTECPLDCKCVQNLQQSLMSCKTWFTENKVGEIPITHFEMSDSKIPISLTENIFVKMGLEHVNVISISNSKIASVDKNAFKGLKELSQIELIGTDISKLHPDTFKIIPNLRTLKLEGNPLKKDTIITSDKLEQLVITKCGLSEITGKFIEKVPSLLYLDLSENNIETLNTGVFDPLIDLQEIHLSHNKLKQIPNDLFLNNEDLSVLNISFNPLITFDGARLEDLETLDLKSCLIKQIDAPMFKNMIRLKNLDLSNNKIATIDIKALAALKDLYVIDLSGNELRKLNDNIFANNTNLQKIRLDNNFKLSSLPSFNAIGYHFATYYFSCNKCNLQTINKNTFRNMPSIVTLLLANNKLSDVSNGVFQNLTSLIELDISHNEIKTFKDNTFEQNVNLEKLTLSNNHLLALHANMFKNNTNLKMLEISNCGLYKLWTDPEIKVQLSALQYLNVSKNNIKIITKDDIAVAKKLKSLDISGNPLECDENLKDLVTYLIKSGIKNTQYLTHEKQSYNFEDRVKIDLNWKEIARNRCPNIIDDDDEKEIDDPEDGDDNDDSEDQEDENTTDSDQIFSFNLSNDIEIEDLEDEPILDHSVKIRRYNISYIWPVLVFLSTALVVLALVANIILFVIRRRQSLPLPRIINVPRMSRLKKNSGLVYQQLSEEHGPKTPILGRLTAIHTIQTYPNDAENV